MALFLVLIPFIENGLGSVLVDIPCKLHGIFSMLKVPISCGCTQSLISFF